MAQEGRDATKPVEARGGRAEVGIMCTGCGYGSEASGAATHESCSVLEGGFATWEHLTDEAQHPPARRPDRADAPTDLAGGERGTNSLINRLFAKGLACAESL